MIRWAHTLKTKGNRYPANKKQLENKKEMKRVLMFGHQKRDPHTPPIFPKDTAPPLNKERSNACNATS